MQEPTMPPPMMTIGWGMPGLSRDAHNGAEASLRRYVQPAASRQVSFLGACARLLRSP